jgi:hypothetical protein
MNKYGTTLLLLTSALLAACGRSDDKSPRGNASTPALAPGPAPRVPPPPPLPPPPAPQALPSTGMLCAGNETFAWTQDDKVQPAKALRIVGGADGSVFEMAPKALVPLSPSSAAPISYPAGLDSPSSAETFIASATSLALASSDAQLHIYKDGTWRSIAAPSKATRLGNAAEINGQWWVATTDALFVVGDNNELTPVETTIKLDYDHKLAGVFGVGADVWIVTQSRFGFPVKYSTDFWKRDAKGAFKAVSKVVEFINDPSVAAVASANDTALLVADRNGMGTLYRVAAKSKPTKLSSDIATLSAIDGAGRIWARIANAVVAYASDGTTTAYPLAAKPNLAYPNWGVTCLPLGGGFANLPVPAAPIEGALNIHIDNAANASVALCRNGMRMSSLCHTAADSIKVTLDASGNWHGNVPIGEYRFTAQINGAMYLPKPARGARLTCKVETDKPCSINTSAQ